MSVTLPNSKRVLKQGRYELYTYTNHHGKTAMCAVKNQTHTDWPMYFNYNVTYDNPEWFSRKFKETVKEWAIENKELFE